MKKIFYLQQYCLRQFHSQPALMRMTTSLTPIKLRERGKSPSLRVGVKITMGHEMNGLIHIQQ